MTSLLLRLFAVFWWLLVIGCASLLVFIAAVLAQYPCERAHVDFVGLLLWIALLLAPYIVMTLIRCIITGRWRFGPRW
jgi:hypothetical protein